MTDTGDSEVGASIQIGLIITIIIVIALLVILFVILKKQSAIFGI